MSLLINDKLKERLMQMETDLNQSANKCIRKPNTPRNKESAFWCIDLDTENYFPVSNEEYLFLKDSNRCLLFDSNIHDDIRLTFTFQSD